MSVSNEGLKAVWLGLLGSLPCCWMVKNSRLFMSGSRRSVGAMVTSSDHSGPLSWGRVGDLVGGTRGETTTDGLIRGGEPVILTLLDALV